jgi:F-type H+-transporting ATPase subunit b
MGFANMTVAFADFGMGTQEAVNVDFHPYLVVFQIGLFVVLMLVLKPVLFDPMMKLFEEREKRIDGAKAAARKIDEKSASALSTYEAEMAKARATANAERDKLRAEGMKMENEILAKVRAATATALEEGKKKAHDEAAKVRATLQSESPVLAKDLASRVLGREVQG